MAARRKVLVTGGNAGIGFALCKQLAIEDNCHVYLCSRSEERGKAAVSEILKIKPVKVELVILDVSKDESVRTEVKAAAKNLEGTKFYGIVNNAGAGFSHNVSSDVILNVNLHGSKRVCDAFLPMLDKKEGRIVNVSSGAASEYIQGSMWGEKLGNASREDREKLLSSDVTWNEILACVEAEKKASCGTIDTLTAYGLSKAGLSAYTMTLAKKYPNILSSSCNPGFVATAMSEGFGAKLRPEQGTVSLRHCLFKKLSGNGGYFGSDATLKLLGRIRFHGDPDYVPDVGRKKTDKR